MRSVNLLPRDDEQRSQKPQNVPALVATALIVLATGLVGVLYFSAKSTVGVKEMELEDAKAELALLPSPAEIETRDADKRRLVGEHQLRVTAVSTALTHRIAWDRVLREISLVLPEDVWLIELIATSPTIPGTAVAPATPVGVPPTGFSMSGFTYSHDAVARLISRLAVLPDLRNVWLERSVRQGLTGSRAIIRFTIKADVRAAGATS